jgi:hypothetical protein
MNHLRSAAYLAVGLAATSKAEPTDSVIPVRASGVREPHFSERAIVTTARRLSRNARVMMRYTALQYRKARACGSAEFMARWLKLATEYREQAKGFLEAA